MQIPVDFENGGTYFNWYLLDAMYWIGLSFFSDMAYWHTNLWKQTELLDCLWF